MDLAETLWFQILGSPALDLTQCVNVIYCGLFLSSKQEDVLNIKSASDLPYLRNPEILVGENDLTSLSYLHEPAGM